MPLMNSFLRNDGRRSRVTWTSPLQSNTSHSAEITRWWFVRLSCRRQRLSRDTKHADISSGTSFRHNLAREPRQRGSAIAGVPA